MKHNESNRMKLHYKPPFNWKLMLGFLRLRAIPGVEYVDDMTYARTFRLDQLVKGWFKVTNNLEQSCLEVEISSNDKNYFMNVEKKIRKMFDLDSDILAIKEILSSDKFLRDKIKNSQPIGLPVAWNPFEFTIRAVLGQQISVKAATTLAGRIVHQCHLVCDGDFPEGLTHYFPNPIEFSQCDLSNIGVTRTRQQTLRNVNDAILNNELSYSDNQTLEQFIKSFCQIKGIGEWTANYVAMRGMGMDDAFPATDLGVIKALSDNDHAPTKKEIITIADKWRPWRAYATLYLWHAH